MFNRKIVYHLLQQNVGWLSQLHWIFIADYFQYSCSTTLFIPHIIVVIVRVTQFIEHYNSANSKNMEVCSIFGCIMLWIWIKVCLTRLLWVVLCRFVGRLMLMFVYCFQRVYDIVPPLFLVLQPPVTRVTSGWLVGPFPTVDVWRYVSTTCGGLSVTMCGELMMHW